MLGGGRRPSSASPAVRAAAMALLIVFGAEEPVVGVMGGEGVVVVVLVVCGVVVVAMNVGVEIEIVVGVDIVVDMEVEVMVGDGLVVVVEVKYDVVVGVGVVGGGLVCRCSFFLRASLSLAMHSSRFCSGVVMAGVVMLVSLVVGVVWVVDVAGGVMILVVGVVVPFVVVEVGVGVGVEIKVEVEVVGGGFAGCFLRCCSFFLRASLSLLMHSNRFCSGVAMAGVVVFVWVVIVVWVVVVGDGVLVSVVGGVVPFAVAVLGELPASLKAPCPVTNLSTPPGCPGSEFEQKGPLGVAINVLSCSGVAVGTWICCRGELKYIAVLA